MPRFTNSRDLRRHLEAAADRLQQEVIITTQDQLGSDEVSPVDTGRFRSSWFASEGSPNRAEAPVEADSPNDDANRLRIRGDRTYYLSNSLPYAQAIAIEGRTNPEANVKSKPANWFASFRNSNIPRIQKAAAKVVKQEFDL